MAQGITQADWPVLAEIGSDEDGAARLARQAMFVALGIAGLTLAAQVQVPVPPSPVPVNLGTFAVLSIGAAYGPRLGLVTILGYMLLGMLGADVFASSTAENNGLHYMMGASGGYLLGYVLATVLLGTLARRGWDRSVGLMAFAMLLGNVAIYIPGIAWIDHVIAAGAFDPAKYATVWDQTLAWGFTPYLIGDAIKLALAALIFPTVWRLVGTARA
ncbi:Substrate-specific component BioY of biotin ECF transporter [Rubellimicrobium mesophilum DSM 19309]|uniref:Biotin transporter n=1 Tax=Rubellimicrobium mesophilum DSM 19309 TaxID=442562 RepID=A0A017HRZ3_9RHOB|nr:biotin transporter BioY [Rubellimicrobium mesophilum]EYD77070.1 Substrate-specific component BioY of biotin ECF transporter [Rubellimicrobium mesophilum DSM 19309]